jgi:hypothetical protein
MARTARARSNRVSYREPSFDDDKSNDDDSYDSEIATNTRHSTRRSQQKMISLKEPSTDEDNSSSESEEESEEQESLVMLPPAKRRRHAARPIAKRTRAATEKKPSSRFSRPRSGRPAAKRAKKQEPRKLVQYETDGICPPWQNLPYEILKNIFDFALASYPDSKGSSWLLGAAKTCKNFSEPALSSLYYSPDLSKSTKIELFFDHMMTQAEGKYLNYHNKVKRLSINTRILGTTFDLIALIRQLPQLAYLDLWSDKDYTLRGLAQVANERYWQPPSNLVEELGQINLPLKSWRWNMRMMPMPLDSVDRWNAMKQFHLQKPLNRIQQLTLTNFNYAVKENEFFLDTTLATLNMAHSAHALSYLPDLDPEIPIEEAIIATDPFSDTLKSLPNIKSLRFEFCNIVQGPWLLRLPHSLNCLELHCSSFLTSWHLERYLQTHGRSLRKLVLDHNPTLNLNFLASLQVSCPDLEEISMDLIYTNPNRADEIIPANFDEMLDKRCVPTWPKSLRKIQILHLRQWESEAAVVFFSSIMDASKNLRGLRHLILSASIDLDWRERTTFRDKWVSDFERVFLRKSDPPAAYLASKKAFRKWKGPQTHASPAKSERSDASDSARYLRPRRATHDDLAASLRSQVVVALGGASEDGMCDVIDIRIDNSRPRENEFRESDFLDSEVSGDEDWA